MALHAAVDGLRRLSHTRSAAVAHSFLSGLAAFNPRTSDPLGNTSLAIQDTQSNSASFPLSGSRSLLTESDSRADCHSPQSLVRDQITRSCSLLLQNVFSASSCINSSPLLLCEKKRSLHTDVAGTPALAFEEIVQADEKESSSLAMVERTIVVIHGLLGQGRNWRGFSRQLVSLLAKDPRHTSKTKWRAVLVDLRNHGKSAGFTPPHNVHTAAADIMSLFESNRWPAPDVVVGHSLGGKLALAYTRAVAQRAGPASNLKQVWVLDSIPGLVDEDDSQDVGRVLLALRELPSIIPSRRWLVDELARQGFSDSLSEWLATSLKRLQPPQGEAATWQFDVEGATAMYRSYCSTEFWDVVENPPAGVRVEFVRAANSDRWEEGVVDRIDAAVNFEDDNLGDGDSTRGFTAIHMLPDAGHWLHVDNPSGLLSIMAPRIASTSI